MTEKTLICSDEIYEQLDRCRLRENVDVVDNHMKVWTESWDEFFQRHLDLNIFIGPEDIIEPDEIDVMDIGMLEE